MDILSMYVLHVVDLFYADLLVSCKYIESYFQNLCSLYI